MSPIRAPKSHASPSRGCKFGSMMRATISQTSQTSRSQRASRSSRPLITLTRCSMSRSFSYGGGSHRSGFRDSARDVHSTLSPAAVDFRRSPHYSWDVPTPPPGSTPILGSPLSRPGSRGSSSSSNASSSYSSRASSRAASPAPSPFNRERSVDFSYPTARPLFASPSWTPAVKPAPVVERRDSNATIGRSSYTQPAVRRSSTSQQLFQAPTSCSTSYNPSSRRSSFATAYSPASSYGGSMGSPSTSSLAPSTYSFGRRPSDADADHSRSSRFAGYQTEGLDLCVKESSLLDAHSVYKKSGPYPTSAEMDTLARELSLSQRQVRTCVLTGETADA